MALIRDVFGGIQLAAVYGRQVLPVDPMTNMDCEDAGGREFPTGGQITGHISLIIIGQLIILDRGVGSPV